MIQDILWHTYTQLGCQAYSNSNYNLAQKMFAAALEEAERDEQNTRRLATSTSNLALVLKQQNQIIVACGLFKKALSLYERLHGKVNLGVAQCLDSMAELHFAKGEYLAARRLYKKTIVTLTAIVGNDHPLLTDRLIKLGLTYINLGQSDHALACYKWARAIAARKDTEKHTSLVEYRSRYHQCLPVGEEIPNGLLSPDCQSSASGRLIDKSP